MKRKISTRLDFLSPLSHVPGLGPKRIAALNESGIKTIGNLLFHFPRRYIDRSTITTVKDMYKYIESTCNIIGTISQTRVEKGRKSRLRIEITDETGSFEAVWFNGISFLRKTLYTGKKILVHGKVTRFSKIQMLHPMIETVGEKKTVPDILYLPQYPITSAMRDAHIQQKALFSSINWILKNLKHYPNILPEFIENKNNFPPLSESLKEIHIPSDPQKLDPFYKRLAYEELYQLALSLRWSKRKFALPGRAQKPGVLPDTLKAHLPFTLTSEQEKAIATLYADSASSTRMHKLLQGDVGSGKTIVAFFACLPALNENLQVAWLAPTEVLAKQTYDLVKTWLSYFSIQPALFKGGMSSGDKRELLLHLKSGKISFVVGTHALLQPSVTFSKIGMIIIDEQHKFGSEQRLKLQEKDPASDFLLMSATPIPQTLAKTLYGDLDIVSIRSIPGNRLPVRTHIVPKSKRVDMEKFISKEIHDSGSQVFCVVPRIDTVDDSCKISDITTVVEQMNRGIFASIPKAAIHGKLDAQEKQDIMERFKKGEIKILIATTVIEVGIDVPNATIMVIENAERFGLSQLHQLRGRVGRGDKQAFTFLLPNDTDNQTTAKRLKKFCSTHNGFEIADLDLSLRGPGEVTGFRQSGWDELHIADILKHADIFRSIQKELDSMLLQN